MRRARRYVPGSLQFSFSSTLWSSTKGRVENSSTTESAMRSHRNRFVLLRGVVCVIALLLGGSLAYGQSTSWARMVGTVTDQSGAVVPGADVSAVNKETNVTHKALTNE